MVESTLREHWEKCVNNLEKHLPNLEGSKEDIGELRIEYQRLNQLVNLMLLGENGFKKFGVEVNNYFTGEWFEELGVEVDDYLIEILEKYRGIQRLEKYLERYKNLIN
tara:strand:- start:183 stop:506 length:324 start_codon:yes stop_codon:yes gene_type:complete